MTTTAYERLAPHTATAPPTPAARARRMWRGADTDPAWVRPTLLLLLLGTGLLYLWNLSASGWANSYYTAAVQAGSRSWKAMFFGSSDGSNFITVDKTPASLWVMALSARLFGFHSWSVLAPQALEGVAAVGILYVAVRRHAGAVAGLLAGTVLALTPVAALMFRFNNPDALLVLLMVAAAYAVLRALEAASTRWLALAGGLIGLGYLTKMLQALLVVPVLGVVYLLAAPTSTRRRIVQLLAAAGAMVVAAGWWVAIVAMMPASARPYIGGSQTNSVLELTLGYNGLGRLTGEQAGSVGGGNGWGETGWLRLFNSDYGMQISYLLPAALVLLVFGLWHTRRAQRTDLARVGFLLWGGWLLLTGAVFSLMQGIIHSYYTVALAPAIGGLVGTGAVLAWRTRAQWTSRVALAVALLATAAWTSVLLDRAPTWLPWLRPAVVTLAVAAALVVLVGPAMRRSVATSLAAVALVAALAAPAAASIATAATPHTGAIPSASPVVQGGGPGGGPGGRPGGRPGGGQGRAFGGPSPGVTGNRLQLPDGAGPMGGGRAGGPGGMGGLLNASEPNSQLVAALQAGASSFRWAAAAVGSNSAAGAQIASGQPVMAIGGFNGSDPAPSLEQFQQYVADGQIHYFLSDGFGGGRADGGSNVGSEIASWVAASYQATTIGGVTVYDLTAPMTNGATGA